MFSEQIVDTTFDYIEEDDEDLEDDYFLSEQRAISAAENEANNVLNKADYKKAKREGKLYKTWISELDNKTRPWHWDAYGQKKGIDEYFDVGGEFMMYPHDTSASPENTIHCRCSVKYE
jgi:hypothetical protein